jgi:hypothetical protein
MKPAGAVECGSWLRLLVRISVRDERIKTGHCEADGEFRAAHGHCLSAEAKFWK